MGAEVVDTAGRFEPAPRPGRRDVIRAIRAALRRQDATDDEVDDALDTLVELARDPASD